MLCLPGCACTRVPSVNHCARHEAVRSALHCSLDVLRLAAARHMSMQLLGDQLSTSETSIFQNVVLLECLCD